MNFCRIKKVVKSFLLWMDLFLYPFLLPYFLKKCNVKQVHFSIDDVEYALKEKSLIVSKKVIDLVGQLNISTTLYLFAQKEMLEGGFSDCFKIAPHRPEDISKKELKHLFSSRFVRFHRYFCSQEDIKLWREQRCCVDGGGAIMLCCDDDVRCSYDLSKEDNKKLNECYLIKKKDVEYRKTNVRLEKPLLFQLLRLRKTNMLVIFGHEWALSSWSRNLSIFVKICKKNEIEFIS